MTEALFFDTYAFFRILDKSSDYNKYTNIDIVTTKLNLFELYNNLLKYFDEKTASNILNKYWPFIVDFDKEIIKEAAKFKRAFGRGVSMTDCVGYVIAKKIGIKFLTGDKQFEFLPDVEFVK